MKYVGSIGSEQCESNSNSRIQIRYSSVLYLPFARHFSFRFTVGSYSILGCIIDFQDVVQSVLLKLEKSSNSHIAPRHPISQRRGYQPANTMQFAWLFFLSS